MFQYSFMCLPAYTAVCILHASKRPPKNKNRQRILHHVYCYLAYRCLDNQLITNDYS